MSKVDIKKSDGAKSGTIELDENIFGIEPNVAVMHQVVNAQLAAKRSGTHSTKTRAEVRGGGAKPWKQKGTGRARAGSSRIPHWRGGLHRRLRGRALTRASGCTISSRCRRVPRHRTGWRGRAMAARWHSSGETQQS